MALFKRKTAEQRRVELPDEFRASRIYDYTTPENRCATGKWLLDISRNERTAKENEWEMLEGYYNFRRRASAEIAGAIEENDLGFVPAVVPDPYIAVESQIIPDVPEPEFHGRDDDRDDERAKLREYAVRYICEANRLNDLNTANERRLRKYGDAFFKAFWDKDMPCGEKRGNIRIIDVPLTDIYPDPTAMEKGLEACEYICYVYTMHKLRFWRVYNDALRERQLTLDMLTEREYRTQNHPLEPITAAEDARADELQIMEFWFRQPADTKDAPAGAIACSTQVGGYEIAYTPDYWQETGRQCSLFPFVHYWCIRDETQFWNRSEISPILGLVDAADRELATGILNDAMMANDIILHETGALAPGQFISNVPGSDVEVNPGKIGSIARLGGLGNGINSTGMVTWLQNQIQRTNRNYDANNGAEPTRVTTASGLLQLRTDANTQQQIKKADRDAGFARLYELLDWLALEFFDDDRLIFIGAKREGEEPVEFRYNRAMFGRTVGGVTDPLTLEEITPGWTYYPRVDVTVSTGDGISRNPATTLSVLDKLAATAVTADNWELIAAELEILDIPQKHDIIDRWRRKFAPAVPPEVTAALEGDAELLQTVEMAIGYAPTAEGGAQAENTMQGMSSAPADMMQGMSLPGVPAQQTGGAEKLAALPGIGALSGEAFPGAI